MDVERIFQLTTRDGPWRTDDRHSRPQTSTERIELEVASQFRVSFMKSAYSVARS
jgi:hypothetical protein